MKVSPKILDFLFSNSLKAQTPPSTFFPEMQKSLLKKSIWIHCYFKRSVRKNSKNFFIIFQKYIMACQDTNEFCSSSNNWCRRSLAAFCAGVFSKIFFHVEKWSYFHFLNVSVLYSLNVFNRIGIHISVSRSKIFFLLFFYLFIDFSTFLIKHCSSCIIYAMCHIIVIL